MRRVDQQPRTAPSLVTEFADLGRALRRLIDPYRPELHYMRGRGPKWHAKYDPPPAKMKASALPARITVNC